MKYSAALMSSARHQSGLSMFGFLMLLIVLAVGLNLGLTLGPHYMDNRAVVQVVEAISADVWTGTSKTKMHEAVNKGLKVNNIRSLKSEDIIKVEKKKNSTDVKIAYEVRENIFANLDIVLVFNKDYTH